MVISLQMNNHLKRKVGRPRKPIWKHFTEIGGSNDNSNNKRPGAKCNYCGEIVSHIALSCTKPPPPDVRVKFQDMLQSNELSEDDEDDNSKTK